MSFWLSFAAVSAIAYGMYAERRKITFIGLLLLTLYFFQQLSLVAFAANLIAIPWIGMLVVPLCLLSTVIWLISGNRWRMVFSFYSPVNDTAQHLFKIAFAFTAM